MTKLPAWMMNRLQASHDRLKALVDPMADSTCAVAPEHKEAVKLYVETWIIPNIEVVMGLHARNGQHDLGDNQPRGAKRNA